MNRHISLLVAAAFAAIVLRSGSASADPVKITPYSFSAPTYYPGRPPQNAGDGDPNTQWNSGGVAPAAITIDLGRPMPVGQIRLLPDLSPHASGNVGLTLLVGDDLANLRTVFSSAVAMTNNSWSTIGYAQLHLQNLGNVRYIRVNTTSSPTWVAWRELEVYSAVEYFGYFGDALEPWGGANFMTETTAAGANMVWIGADNVSSIVTRLGQAQSLGVKAFVSLEYLCWTGLPTRMLLRDSNGLACPQLAALQSQIAAAGLLGTIASMYLIDEPYLWLDTLYVDYFPASTIESEVNELAIRVKLMFPGKPVSMITDYLSLNGEGDTFTGDTVSSFAHIDWVGFDEYFVTSSRLDNNYSKLRALLPTSNQRMLAVPEAASFSTSLGEQYYTISGVLPLQSPIGTVKTGGIDYWHKKVLSDAKFVGIAAFSWDQPQPSSQPYNGARNLPWVRDRNYQMQASLIPLPQFNNRVYGVWHEAVSTYTDDFGVYGAFSRLGSSDSWNAGGPASQWIYAHFGGPTQISRIELTVNQDIYGSSEHVLYGITAAGALTPLTTFSGFRTDGQVLTWNGSQSLRGVMIMTNTSPTWVSWRDIAFYR